ncbi:hypothetical protein BGZ73_006829 [Actinomortierella ambigua]|nr:hypothetical protein BGZ73_006829 [Actinomortierella ambigua]
MQALYSVGVELQECPDESLPDVLAYLAPMITEPVHEFCETIARITKNQLATSAFETKKEMCKAIYALSATLNHAIVVKESFIIEKTETFLKAFRTWRTSCNPNRNIPSAFAGPAKEVRKYASHMFPPVHVPQDDFKPHFARFCHSFRLPVSMRDLESMEPLESTTGRKEGYLFHRNRAGEWSRQYFYILHPQGWLMMFAKGGRVGDSMESVLQAATKVDFDEWKAALSAWIPPDEDIPAIEQLKISSPTQPPPPAPAPTTKQSIFQPRQRLISLGRVSDAAPTSPRQRMSVEFPVTELPFETIPLYNISRTHISLIDSSLLSKKHCFSIRTAHHVNYYTVSQTRSRHDQEILHTWIHALKSYAKPEIFGSSMSSSSHEHASNGSSGNSHMDVDSTYRIYRTFSVLVNDGKLNKDVEAYCEITLDGERRARTSARSRHTKGIEPGTPFWRDSFIFSDLPPFRKGITINVTQVKGNKQLPIGQVDIPVHHRKEWDEGWYPINANRARSNQHEGDLRLKLRYEELIVLPMDIYAPLLNIILNHQENNVISRLAELVTDLEGFAKNVLHILEAKGMATVWLNSLIDEEIAQANAIGTEYLDDTLGDILRGICASKSVCEVDPSRLERGGSSGGGGGVGGLGGNHDELKANWRTLYHHTRVCWRAVTESVPYFPRQLQVVFSHLQMRLTEKFKDPIPSDDAEKEDLAALARYTGVSGFVFLRLICPAILGPKLFCIMREHPEAKAHRTLTLIAKSLQGLANLVMFGNKESWMVPMNEFIAENMQSLKDFIDRICMAEPMSSSRIDSGASSVRSVQIYPPQSPGSATSAVFRNLTSHHPKTPTATTNYCRNGSSGPGNSPSQGGGGGGGGSNVSNMYQHSNQSTASSNHHFQTYQCGPTPPAMALSVTTSTIASGTAAAPAVTAAMSSSPPSSSPSPRTSPLPYLSGFVPERADELPVLPYLIDLGKELASFATTVAHLPSLIPSSSSSQSSSSLASSHTGIAAMTGMTKLTTTTTNKTTPSSSSNASSLAEGRTGVETATPALSTSVINGGAGTGSSSSARHSYDHPPPLPPPPLAPALPPPLPPRPPASTRSLYSDGRGTSIGGGGEHDEEDEFVEDIFDEDGDEEEDDIVRQVYRHCWHLMEEVEDRVERVMGGVVGEEGDDDRRSLSGASSVHRHQYHQHHGRGKVSREESRNGDEGGGGLAGYMAAAAGLHPSVHQYYQHGLQPPPPYQSNQQQQYLIYEQYGGDGSAAADNYYYYYGMDGQGSEDEGPI